MESYTEYWVASMTRGLLAIVAAIGVLVMPQMISLVFLLPFAILISMMLFAVYGTLDSVIVLITSFLITRHDRGRLALRIQGVCGATCGVLLFFLVYDRAQLPWFIYLAAAQAACVAVTEFTVALRTSIKHGSRWCFAAADVAAFSAMILLLGRRLEPQGIAWLLFGYLGIFGITLCVLSARMLFQEQRTRTHKTPPTVAAMARL